VGINPQGGWAERVQSFPEEDLLPWEGAVRAWEGPEESAELQSPGQGASQEEESGQRDQGTKQAIKSTKMCCDLGKGHACPQWVDVGVQRLGASAYSVLFPTAIIEHPRSTPSSGSGLPLLYLKAAVHSINVEWGCASFTLLKTGHLGFGIVPSHTLTVGSRVSPCSSLHSEPEWNEPSKAACVLCGSPCFQ
jgi:hypothetical protein